MYVEGASPIEILQKGQLFTYPKFGCANQNLVSLTNVLNIHFKTKTMQDIYETDSVTINHEVINQWLHYEEVKT